MVDDSLELKERCATVGTEEFKIKPRDLSKNGAIMKGCFMPAE
jgi:hypothetical protein